MYAVHGTSTPSMGTAAAYMDLVNLSNEAMKLAKAEKLNKAEEILRDVLERKPAVGFDAVSIALTQHELGSVLRRLERTDEALEFLHQALETRERFDRESEITIALSDSNLTREEIAKVYEAKSDCAKALETREEGKRICGSDACNSLDYKEKLQGCSRCKSVFYCSKACQRQDWKHRHKLLCQPAAP